MRRSSCDYIQGDETVWERDPVEKLAHDGQMMGFKYYRSEYFGQNSIEIEAFGRRSLATRVEGCIYDPKNERVRA